MQSTLGVILTIRGMSFRLGGGVQSRVKESFGESKIRPFEIKRLLASVQGGKGRGGGQKDGFHVKKVLGGRAAHGSIHVDIQWLGKKTLNQEQCYVMFYSFINSINY